MRQLLALSRVTATFAAALPARAGSLAGVTLPGLKKGRLGKT